MLRRFATKAAWRLVRTLIVLVNYVSVRHYMRLYTRYLRLRGAKIRGAPRYISPTCQLDGGDFGLIEIGHNAVISSNVRILTHDYALTRAFLALGIELEREVASVRPVAIGDNCFVGTNTVLMPGCRLGRNVIVGAGSVVRGEVPENAIVAGNPAEVIGDTLDWGRSRLPLLEGGRLREDPAWMGSLDGEARVPSLGGA